MSTGFIGHCKKYFNNIIVPLLFLNCQWAELNVNLKFTLSFALCMKCTSN